MDRTPNLTERLLNPETVEAAIPALVQGIYQNIRANLAVPEVKAAVDAIRELHARLATAKAEGAAEAYEAEAVEHDMAVVAALESDWDWTGGYFRLRAKEARERAAALRKQVLNG